MPRIRTILGLHNKGVDTIDGYRPDKGRHRLYRDDEGIVYGGLVKATCEDTCERTEIYDSKTGMRTFTRISTNDSIHMAELERLTGKSLTPVDAVGVIPTLYLEGFGWSHVKNNQTPKWYKSLPDTVREKMWDGRYAVTCLPLLVPKKYTNKLEMKDVSLDTLIVEVEPTLQQFSTEHGIGNEVVQ